MNRNIVIKSATTNEIVHITVEHGRLPNYKMNKKANWFRPDKQTCVVLCLPAAVNQPRYDVRLCTQRLITGDCLTPIIYKAFLPSARIQRATKRFS